jgi:hypothetical protein
MPNAWAGLNAYLLGKARLDKFVFVERCLADGTDGSPRPRLESPRARRASRR